MTLQNNYLSSIKDLDRLTQQKLHQADEEHKALSNTIRQRLVSSITKKRQQLLRDKEQLDIADSNALLLHPAHFSINNPGSPGNGVGNRKTRHLRHRAGSPNPGDLEANGKRKRKAAAMEDEGNESPAPGFKPLPAPDALGGGRSPFKDAREKNTYTQYEAPAYSLERIFTDKELAMATDTAKLATWRYFHQPQQQQGEPGSTSNGTAVPSIDGDPMDTAEGEEVGAAPTTEGPNGTPPPLQPAAPEMERSTSHQVLTRGGARANPLAALNDLAMVAETARTGDLRPTTRPFEPVVPTYHAVTRSEKSGAPAPSSVSHTDADNDFKMMRRMGAQHFASAGDEEVLADSEDEESATLLRRQLLDQAVGESSVTQPYRLPLLETGPAVIGKGIDRVPGNGFAPFPMFQQQVRQAAQAVGAGASMAAALQGRLGAVGGEPMSRTTSAGGGSELGGEVTVVALPARRGRGRLLV